MAGAIREVTIERGRDPRDFTLVAYGGAGPLHAAQLASELEIPRVLVPAGAGTFAAFGMLMTDLRHDVSRSFVARVDTVEPAQLSHTFAELEEEATAYLASGLSRDGAERVRHVRRADLRYAGQFHTLTVTLPAALAGPASIAELFHTAHLNRYGHSAPEEHVEVLALRVTAVTPVAKPGPQEHEGAANRGAGRSRPVLFDTWLDTAAIRHETLTPGARVSGPAVLEDATTNIVVRPGDVAEVLEGGHVAITIGAAA